MKNIFSLTGHKLYTKPKLGTKKISLSFFLNPDGSVRWYWNSNCKKPLFLKFYNTSTLKSKLFSFLIKLVFALRIQKLIFRRETVFCSTQENPVFDINDDWAIFTGTVGPNNKGLLYTNDYFYKIAETNIAKDLIKNEFIKSIHATKSDSFHVPNVSLLQENILRLSDISTGGIRENEFGKIHANALKGMNDIYEGKRKVSDWNYFQKLKENYNSINDKRISPSLLRKINSILQNISDDEMVDISFSHGDFTSWNCYVKDDILAIYDWEMASFERSKGFDFFHYIIQNGVLIHKKSWKEIYTEILEKNEIAFQFSDNDLEKYLKYYLLTNTLTYLKIYSQQQNWHQQVYWLLRIWTEGFNYFSKSNENRKRTLDYGSV